MMSRDKRELHLSVSPATRDFLGPPRGRKAPSVSNDAFARAKGRALLMMDSGDWTEATPRDFVAAYALSHEKVYGIAPDELTPPIRARAALAAAMLLKHRFAADPNAMAAFLRWVWVREVGREKWRRENRKSGGRIGWRLQFAADLVSDFKLDAARTGQ